MKLKNVLMISFLAIAGIFGASSAIVNNEVKETPVVEKAEAATTKNTIYIYAEDQRNDWNDYRYFASWDDKSNRDLKIKITAATFASGSGYAALSNIPTEKMIVGEKTGTYVWYDSTNKWVYAQFYGDAAADSEIKYSIELPWIFSSITYTYVSTMSNRNMTTTNLTASAGKKYKDYIYHGSYVSSSQINFAVSHQDDTGTSTDSVDSKTASYYDARVSTSTTIKTENVLYWTYYNPTDVSVLIDDKVFDAWYASYNSSTGAFSTKFTGPFVWHEEAYSFFGKYTGNSHTITYYYYDTNGNTVSSSTSVSKESGVAFNLPTPSHSGYHFVKWHTAYNSTTHTFSGDEYDGGASFVGPKVNTSLYAEFVANNTYLVGSFNSWIADASSIMSSSPYGDSNFLKSITLAVNDIFKIRKTNNSTESWYGFTEKSNGDTNDCFTNDASDNIKCTVAGSYDIYFTGSNIVIYQVGGEEIVPGYYLSGTGTFAGSSSGWSIIGGMEMLDTSSVEGSTNLAILENPSAGIAVSAGSTFKVAYVTSLTSEISFHSMNALGDSYSFAEIGTDDYGEHFIRIKTTGNYNFYYGRDYKMYIVDFSEIQKAGTLYYTSSKSDISAIKVTTVNTKSENPFDNVGLDNVDGARKMSTTLKYGSGYVYLIPIFNLRGSDTGSAVTTVTLDGTTITVTGLGGNSQNYYIEGSTTNEDKYIGLKVALDIDEAIQDTTGKSVCEVDPDVAAALCERYDKVTPEQGSSALAISTIHTWAKAKGDSGDDIPMRSIRIELGNRSGDPKYSSAIRSFNPFSMINGEDGGNNATTIIIIIAASVSLLSITALSILLVKKRKRVDN